MQIDEAVMIPYSTFFIGIMLCEIFRVTVIDKHHTFITVRVVGIIKVVKMFVVTSSCAPRYKVIHLVPTNNVASIFHIGIVGITTPYLLNEI
jgi:hypothetical protein